MAGIFKVVATPIGNLGDISVRAKEVLKSASVILAEDTRKTHQLVQALGLSLLPGARIISCYAQVEADRAAMVIERLTRGEDVALVSDAGTPGISDPGTLLIDEIVQAGFSIEVIPGPCACIAALSGAGLRAPRFAFLGFLPERRSVRERLITSSYQAGLSLVIYESALRVASLLAELHDFLGARRVVVARELTKLYETFHRGQLGALLSPPLVKKGECVVVVEYVSSGEEGPKLDEAELKERIRQCATEGTMRPKEIAKLLAKEFNISAQTVYEMLVAMQGKKG